MTEELNYKEIAEMIISEGTAEEVIIELYERVDALSDENERLSNCLSTTSKCLDFEMDQKEQLHEKYTALLEKYAALLEEKAGV